MGILFHGQRKGKERQGKERKGRKEGFCGLWLLWLLASLAFGFGDLSLWLVASVAIGFGGFWRLWVWDFVVFGFCS